MSDPWQRARRGAGATAIVLLVTLIATSGVAGARETVVTYGGQGCREAVTTFHVPVERALSELPDGWQPYSQDASQAVAGVAVLSCAVLTVSGTGAPGGLLSDVGILVRTPGNPAVPAWYQLWQHGDVGTLHAVMARLGVPGDLAKLSLGETSATPATTVGRVDARGGDYAVSVTAPAAGVPAPDSATTWWHDGSRGRVKLDYRLTGPTPLVGSTAAVGPGRLEAEPGSRLARLAGGAETSVVGLSLTFDFSATARLVSADG